MENITRRIRSLILPVKMRQAENRQTSYGNYEIKNENMKTILCIEIREMQWTN
jgi:hypothetical protein